MEELRAMALFRSWRRSIICTRKDCRAGMSRALMQPRSSESSTICQTWIVPENISAASSRACTIDRT
jgi:hypothetical protein